MKRHVLLSMTLALFCLAAPHASAAPILTPPGLLPGQEYQLAFISSEAIPNAMSSNINDYNNFVQGVAAGAGLTTINGQSVTWHAIGSTATVNANANALVLFPVYNLGGQNVATGFTDMWDGNLNNPINFDQSGNLLNNLVYTGSNSDGTAHPLFPLGSLNGNTVVGFSGSTGSNWIVTGAVNYNAPLPLYALSDPITVPFPAPVAAIPEPSTLSILAAGLGIAGWWRRRRAA